MDIKDISQQSQRIDLAAQRERLSSPEIIQMPGSSRGGGGGGKKVLHLAYCKTDAPASPSIICYLDKDIIVTDISTISRSSDIVTATLASVTGFQVGDSVVITDVADSSFDGTFTITGVGTNDITYAQAGDEAASSGGKATVSNGKEITVNCAIAGGGNLNEALPRLTKGLWITVWGGGTFSSVISTISRLSNIVTATLASVAGFQVGDSVVITDVADSSFDGTFTITGVGASTITYAQTGGDATSSGGKATVNNGWFCTTTFQAAEDCTCTTPE